MTMRADWHNKPDWEVFYSGRTIICRHMMPFPIVPPILSMEVLYGMVDYWDENNDTDTLQRRAIQRAIRETRRRGYFPASGIPESKGVRRMGRSAIFRRKYTGLSGRKRSHRRQTRETGPMELASES